MYCPQPPPHLFGGNCLEMKIKIPTPLYSYTGHKSLVEAKGSSLDAITRDLDRNYPGIRFRIVDEQDQIRTHVKFFVNGKQIFNLATRVDEKDEVAIVQAFSGG